MKIAQDKRGTSAALGNTSPKASPLPIRWGEGRERAMCPITSTFAVFFEISNLRNLEHS